MIHIYGIWYISVQQNHPNPFHILAVILTCLKLSVLSFFFSHTHWYSSVLSWYWAQGFIYLLFFGLSVLFFCLFVLFLSFFFVFFIFCWVSFNWNEWTRRQPRSPPHRDHQAQLNGDILGNICIRRKCEAEMDHC